MQLSYSIPLNWPRRLPVTPMRQRSFANGFKGDMSLGESIGMLEEELRELGLERATLSCDIEHPTNDRLRKKLSEDSGICLNFTLGAEAYCIAIDRWYLMAHNIYAASLFLRSLRSIERWGVADLAVMLQSFRARGTMSESVAPDQGDGSWRQQLGLGPGATLEDAHAVYRSRAKRFGEDQEALTRLNLAMEEARRLLS